MRKILLAILCLFIVSCGGRFDLRVHMKPQMTTTTPVIVRAPATPTPVPAPTSTVTLVTPTVTPTAQPFVLVSIQMDDIRYGWGVAASGRTVKTDNAGVSWHDTTPTDEEVGQYGLFSLNFASVWVVPTQLETSGVVWRTSNAGTSWQRSQPLPLNDGTSYTPIRIQFADANYGWLLVLAQDGEGDHVLLYSSNNGGADWVQASIQDSLVRFLPSDTTSMVFIDADRGWLGGGWAQKEPPEWLMLKTGDGGEGWGTDTFRLPEKKDIQCDGHAIEHMKPGAMAVEVICTIPKDAKYLYHHIYYLSESTGPVWRSWAIPGKFLSMDFLNDHHGWMMVASDDPQANRILYTRDGGETWKVVSRVAWRDAQLDFITEKIGWAVTGKGFAAALYRTEDGGKNWIQVRPAVWP